MIVSDELCIRLFLWERPAVLYDEISSVQPHIVHIVLLVCNFKEPLPHYSAIVALSLILELIDLIRLSVWYKRF